jgi:LCP family protein required for cell wall assembly
MLLTCFAGCTGGTSTSSGAPDNSTPSASKGESASATPTPTPSPSGSPSGSDSETPTPVPTPTPTPTPTPSETPSDDPNVNTSLTLEELKLLWEQLKENQTTDTPIDSEEQSKIDEQIKNAIEANKDPISDKEVYNLLIIGYEDKANNGAKNSDSMILLSINFKLKTFTITSFMRDSYVQIPGVGNNRLNVAYAVKGYPLLKATIENNFGITIDNYVALTFDAFIKFFDALGGLDINLQKNEIEHMNKHIPVYYKVYAPADYPKNLEPVKEGVNHLDGVQLLVYVRNRTSGGTADFGRTQRQRTVMSETIKKMTTLSVDKLYELLELTLPMVTTDVPPAECSSLLMKMITRNAFSFKQQTFRIPDNGTWEEKIVRIAGTNQQVLSLNFAENTKRFKKLVYGVDS